MKKILVLNAGSSSIKYQLFQLPDESVLAKGIVEKIGETGSAVNHAFSSEDGGFTRETNHINIPDHTTGLKEITDRLSKLLEEQGESKIAAVGHRVVHGAEKFSKPTLVNEEVISQLKALSYLAPLHNPVNIMGMEVAMQLYPGIPQVAVFDTAFHQTIPDFAYRFAIPNAYYNNHGLRVYGFHGTSHAFVAKKAAAFLQRPYNEFNGITIHLGNGCSISAIKNGKSVDTSMGLTPLGGLIMGTRSGDIDPSLIFFLQNNLNLSANEVDKLLNKQSGLLGLTGEQDLRNILSRYEKGDKEAILAIKMYTYRIKKYVGAYIAALGQVDAIVFTGGVGENSSLIRHEVCKDLGLMGIAIDVTKNNQGLAEGFAIHDANSKINLLVIPTNEELEIARQAYAALES